MTALRQGRGGFPAPYALPVALAALFAVGTVAAGLNGRLPATGVLIAAAVVVGITSFLAEPVTSVPLGIIGWLTVTGFSHPPYSHLRPTGRTAADAAIVMAAVAFGSAAAGTGFRWLTTRSTLDDVGAVIKGNGRGRDAAAGSGAADQAAAGPPGTEPLLADPGSAPGRVTRPSAIIARRRLSGAITNRRRLSGVALALIGLPLLTLLLVAARQRLNLADDLLVFLLAVVTVTVVGGFWPAVLAAVAASLLLNWYLTPPLHTFTIEEPRNLLALVLFVTVAVAVSSIVHLAARRAVQAAASREETASLLGLARTVLSGADTPTAVLDHLTTMLGGYAELQERTAGRWISVAISGSPADEAGPTRIHPRPDLALLTSGQTTAATTSLLAGFGAQAAAALDRERLRMQASQAEALAEGNRIRTALLAAVSHDLRTPLASIKASVSSLRQTDVEWTAADQAALLATIEQNADRLDALIGNLLDLSRLHTGSLEPFLRPTAIDEVAPVALRGLDAPNEPAQMEIAVPDGVPLVRADPGLLERVLANLFSNALRHSPPSRPPLLSARPAGETVVLEVIDHGQGVPDNLKERIFEPFQRLDDRHAGVGLGLAVAKGFAEAMGGSIAAADTPGGGLTIRVSLPVASSDNRSVLGAGQ
jgi:two-component system, OmpR family, sensor histidine kinase KdpD